MNYFYCNKNMEEFKSVINACFLATSNILYVYPQQASFPNHFFNGSETVGPLHYLLSECLEALMDAEEDNEETLSRIYRLLRNFYRLNYPLMFAFLDPDSIQDESLKRRLQTLLFHYHDTEQKDPLSCIQYWSEFQKIALEVFPHTPLLKKYLPFFNDAEELTDYLDSHYAKIQDPTTDISIKEHYLKNDFSQFLQFTLGFLPLLNPSLFMQEGAKENSFLISEGKFFEYYLPYVSIIFFSMKDNFPDMYEDLIALYPAEFKYFIENPIQNEEHHIIV